MSCDVPKCFTLLSAMPGFKKWVDRILLFRPTGANIAFIMEHWPDAEWLDGTQDHVSEYLDVKMQEQTMRAMKHDQLIDESGYEFKTIPYEHQRHGFILSRELPNFAILYEQGCGKTKVTLDTFAYLWEHDKVDVLVVVAPNGVHHNWIIEEVPKHLPERIKARMMTYSNHMKKTARTAMEMEAKPFKFRTRRPCTIVAFNVEGFTSDKAKTMITQFLTNHRCMLVVDESNTIQNPGTVRTKFLIKVGELASYKRILNGTPITNGVENLFAQFKFLDPLILGYDTFTTFKAQFCIMGGFENHSVVGYRHVTELADIIDGSSHRVLKKGCLDLPDKIYKRHMFEMTDQQFEMYEAVRKSTLAELERVFGEPKGRALAAEITLTTMLRLQQISRGWMPFKKGEPAELIPGGTPSLEALTTLLSNVEGKAIIWVNAPNSIVDIALLAAQLRKSKLGNFVEYHGAISDDGRKHALKRFQDDARCKFFLASKAASRGLTLTAADQAFYYTNNFDLMVRLQSEDRCHRIGSEIHDHILYTDIFTTGIDKKIVTALRNKKSIADQITRDPASLFME
jgi:hypothetical protein